MAPEARTYPEGMPFSGVVGRTPVDSIPAWPQPARPPAAAPNVLVVLLDDVGFADFGCFGSAIRTPTFDGLAAGGLRYRQFHTTALCTPSRSCLLTGRNHHANASGWLPSSPLGFPGYNAMVPRENGFLSEILLGYGYATFALGKWHLTPSSEIAAGSTRARWPLSRGFERFYGFIGARTSQWAPDLVYDNHPVVPPRTPEDGYHLNEDLADRAIEFLSDLRAVDPDRPFFMYYCPGACHFPHHVPREWADRYAGQFDRGWDQLRDETFARQLELGVVPEGTTLSPRPDSIPAWHSVGEDEQRVYARQMEVYAGFLEHTDHHIGRVLSFLSAAGELENTLVLVTSDNGADGADPRGSLVRGRAPDPAASPDDWGADGTYPSYSRAWAWVGNTPCRRWKRFVHEGGISDPLVVHWPRSIEKHGEVRDQYLHITDITPTLLDVLGIDPPREIDGVAQNPLHGVSFAHTFDDPEAPTRKRTQYYEMTGSRAIWADGWKAVTANTDDVPLDEDTLATQRWELFYVPDDFAECSDLSERHPEKLRELIERWWTEAGRYGVLPLHGYKKARDSSGAAEGQHSRSCFVYYPGAAPVPATLAPAVNNRSHRITSTVEIPDGRADGVLLAHGNNLYGGYALYMKNDRLHYVQASPGHDEQRVTSDSVLATGAMTLAVDVTMTGDDQATAVLLVNDREVGRAPITSSLHLLNGHIDPGVRCGYDRSPTVTSDYRAPFTFTGVIRHTIVELGEPAPSRSEDHSPAQGEHQ